MSTEYEFGVYINYKAITKIHLGTIGEDLPAGGVIGYDGSNTMFGGKVYCIPSIPGAIKLGWLVPINGQSSNYVPQPSGVQVRPATSANQERGSAMSVERAIDDERKVGSLLESNAKRNTAVVNQFNNTVVEQQPSHSRFAVVHEDPTDRATEFNSESVTAKVIPSDSIKIDDYNNEDARPVARLSPVNNMKAIDVSDSRAVSSELKSLDPVVGNKPKVAKVANVTKPVTNMAAYNVEDLLPDVTSSGKPAGTKK